MSAYVLFFIFLVMLQRSFENLITLVLRIKRGWEEVIKLKVDQ